MALLISFLICNEIASQMLCVVSEQPTRVSDEESQETKLPIRDPAYSLRIMFDS